MRKKFQMILEEGESLSSRNKRKTVILHHSIGFYDTLSKGFVISTATTI